MRQKTRGKQPSFWIKGKVTGVGKGKGLPGTREAEGTDWPGPDGIEACPQTGFFMEEGEGLSREPEEDWALEGQLGTTASAGTGTTLEGSAQTGLLDDLGGEIKGEGTEAADKQ